MALAGAGGATSKDGEAFLTGAIVMATFVAACCSSPQTAEINADSRAKTLMKWVRIGLVTGGVFVVAAAIYDQDHAKPILAGGIGAGTAFYIFYAHAKVSGLASSEPSTET
jgi:hypothetical protein